jgi:HEAT repeats/HEAT repeat
MPRNRVWFIPVLLNETEIPSHSISDHETLKDINAVMLYEDWNDGLTKILRSMKLGDPDHRRTLHLIDLIRYHPAERKHALEQLASIAGVGAIAVPVLIEALRDADSRVRRLASTTLGQIGLAAVPLLIETLRDADSDVRGAAANALGQIGPAAAEAVPLLIEALRDADSRVREAAANALKSINHYH